MRLDQLRATKLLKKEDTPRLVTTINLPPLRAGYHRLGIETPEGLFESLVISAPPKSYSSPELLRSWGAFLPMYAAHSDSSWGAGNFSDWKAFAEWTASVGGGIVGCLPLLAQFIDDFKCEPSPYSPASRLFWNEFFIDVTRVPEFGLSREAQKLVGSRPFQTRLQKFRRASVADYAEEMKLRRDVLERLAKSFFSKRTERRAQFEKFLRSRPQVRDYAAFRAVCERRKESWHSWPQRMRDGKLQSSDYSSEVARYHEFVQWIAQEQMDDVLQSCRDKNVSFYLDLPLGVNADGYDVWRERDAFARGVNAGAPPDIFFTRGQDWGFAPLHPRKMREQGYRYLLEMLRFQMRHTGLLRIDHVMGLRRLYWIPQGRPAKEGAYVSYPAEELYAILCLESHRHKCMIVGENLGTVPPEVNDAMLRYHLRQMYVVQYETCPNPKKALRDPALRVVASLNTHDMPPFAAFWTGEDITDRFKLGLMSRADLHKERRARTRLTRALATFLKKRKFLKGTKVSAQTVMEALLRYLAKSDAEIMLVNLEDLWLETKPQNVPGTNEERVNWRRKAKLSLEQLAENEPLAQFLRELGKLRKKTR